MMSPLPDCLFQLVTVECMDCVAVFRLHLN